MIKKILYHGSSEIITAPAYGFGKIYNDYGQGVIVQRVWNWQENGFWSIFFQR